MSTDSEDDNRANDVDSDSDSIPIESTISPWPETVPLSNRDVTLAVDITILLSRLALTVLEEQTAPVNNFEHGKW
jgi:hypothetical protein